MGGDFLLPSSLEDSVPCSTDIGADAGDVAVQDLVCCRGQHGAWPPERGAGRRDELLLSSSRSIPRTGTEYDVPGLPAKTDLLVGLRKEGSSLQLSPHTAATRAVHRSPDRRPDPSPQSSTLTLSQLPRGAGHTELLCPFGDA